MTDYMLNGGKGVLHVDTWGTFGTRKIDKGFDVRWISFPCSVGRKNILEESIILCLCSR